MKNHVYNLQGTSSGPFRDLVIGLFFILLIFLILICICSIRTVPVGHVGIVTSFGNVTGKTFDSGLHITAPWHHVTKLDTRILNTDTQTECFSKDLQLLQVKLNILTTLPRDRASSVFKTVGPQYLEQITPRVFEILKQNVSQYTAELIIENRDKIRTDVLSACRARLGDIVEFHDIVLTNIDFSDAYEKAIESKQVAQQESLKAKYELEKAKVEAEKAIATAEGEAEAIRIKGTALKESPGMAQLEAIKKWDGKAPQTVVLSGNDTQGLPVVFPIR
ncbi:MAG: prohibitin family protein [Thermoguttaceae bacterium]